MTASPLVLLLAGVVSMDRALRRCRSARRSSSSPTASAVGLAAALVGLALGAAAWALGSHTNNYQYATTGRKAVLVPAPPPSSSGRRRPSSISCSRPAMGSMTRTHRLVAHGRAHQHLAAKAGGGGRHHEAYSGRSRAASAVVQHDHRRLRRSRGHGLATAITKAILVGFFRRLLDWVATGAASLVGAFG